MRYAFIQSQDKIFSASGMCRMLAVSRSGYYEWLDRPESLRSQEDKRQGEMVREIHGDSRETYGARRIRQAMKQQNEPISRVRTRRLMQQQNVSSKVKKKFKATTHSRHNLPVADNVLDRQFSVDQPNKVYVGDITYIATDEGWLYLAVLIDLFSRAVVGWSMSERINASLVNDALAMAIGTREPSAGLLVHSDRGSQYASTVYQKTIQQNQFICSMSRKGNCWDNAPSESFFHTLKTELTHHERYLTRAQAKQSIFDYIEVFYNRKRIHSTINYQAPLEYEKAARKIV